VRRVALFALALVLLGGAAASVGYATRGDAAPSVGSMEPMVHAGTEANGLASSAGGFTLVPERTSLAPGAASFRFRILDDGGRPASAFDLEGGVRLHLIVVRRDFAGYQHVHPRLAADGSWRADLQFPQPGLYRAFADFEVGGEKTVLGHDFTVRGSFAPRELAAPSLRTTSGAYTVELAHASLHAGETTPLSLTVRRAGVPVALERYVGARGHLVALHDGDLAYTHVHPLEGGERGEATFESELAEAGRYRLFFQFKTRGRVHTASFTVEVAR
jgi:hypothetical protein